MYHAAIAQLVVIVLTLIMAHTHTQLVEDWNIDAGSYTFTRLDVDKQEDRETVNKFLLWEGDFGGKRIADGKIYK